jgi:DNA primase
MALPPRFLDELRARVSLAGVVGRHVRLIKRGREYVALCPFHKEKTPSFNVVEEKGFYHCFGCGAHGDVIGFSMRAENLAFREAVEALAKQAGLTLPDDTPQERERAAQVATLYDACESACGYFESQLQGARGAAALDYLRRRGVGPELMARFRLGYAPGGSAQLAQALTPHFPEPLLIEAGLLRRDESGRVYDFFRDRVIFPILDRQGRVIAFGGRALGDTQPKYLNSPDSPVFQKGRTLFALSLARKAVRAEAPPIVAEGYMDVIALHGAGFASAVAPLGTALTEEQLAELWQLAPEPVLCFDGDAAGRRAASRALERALPLLRLGLTLHFVTLPPGEDPDSLIQAQGAAAFARHLAAAWPLSEYLWHAATEGRKFPTLERRAKLQEELQKKILLIEDRQVQRLYMRYVGDRLWDMYVGLRDKLRTRKGGDGKNAFFEEFERWLGATAAREKIQLVMLGFVLNHPHVARDDIDQFASVAPERRELRELHQRVMAEIAADPDLSAPGLRDRLVAAGFGRAIDRIMRSDVYRTRKFAHAGATESERALGWRALFSRYLLPDLRQQLDEALARFNVEATEENWATVMMYRALFEEQNTEEKLIDESRDPVEKREWRPHAAA